MKNLIMPRQKVESVKSEKSNVSLKSEEMVKESSSSGFEPAIEPVSRVEDQS